MCSVLNPYCKLITQQSLYRVGMKKIQVYNFSSPQKPILQGHTSVNAVNGTLGITRKEVQSSALSSLGSSGYSSASQRLGCRRDQFTDGNSIKRNCYFILSNLLVICAMEQLFSEVFWPHNWILYQDHCVYIALAIQNLVVSFSLCRCTTKHKCSYSLNDFLINGNCMVIFSSHNQLLQAEETTVAAQWVKSFPSDRPMRARNQMYFQSIVFVADLLKYKNMMT